MRTTTAMTAALVLLATPVAARGETDNERAEAGMLSAINEVRSRHGLDGLRVSSSLAGSAGRFSRWLVEHDTFGHLGSIQASGEFSLLGEALAMHDGHRFKVRRTLDRWLDSASHRALVLTRTMRWVGAGVTRGRMGARPATVWVLHIGRLRPSGTELRLPGLPLP